MQEKLHSKIKRKIITIRQKEASRFAKKINISSTLYNWAYEKKSYSQCGEDLIINHIFETLGITKPTYMDIGAHHPYYLSNTAFFYRKGGRGVNIEADPRLFKPFIKQRKGDINLNIGISKSPGKLKFYIMDPPTLNTFSEKEAKKYEKMGHAIKSIENIQVKTVRSVANKYFKNINIDLLCIDIEGLDYEVLKEFDFKKHKPIVVCIETIGYTRDNTGAKDDRIIRYLINKGYKVYADTKINTIFVSNGKAN